MKKLIAIYLFLTTTVFGFMQTLEKGNYISDDGKLILTIEHIGDKIILTEPSRVNEYKLENGNLYRNTEPKYNIYMLKVTGTKEYYSLKDGYGSSSEYRFTFTGNTSEEPITAYDCLVSEKYIDLMDTQPNDAQTWAFCGGVAFARCNYEKEAADDYTRIVVTSLKSILVNPSVCPCTDAIPASFW